MMKHLKILLMLLVPGCVLAQVTIRLDSLPQDTPKDAKIYISGDFEGWSGGQEDYALTQKNGKYQITLPKVDKPIQFKFTMGSWETVEKNSKGEDIANRIYKPTTSIESINLIIESWSAAKVESTSSLNVHVFDEAFYMPQLDRTRKIWVYLPPDYNNSDKAYPVIYMHDGQNLFDFKTSYTGEWQVDETLNALFLEKQFACIVIGIDNGGPLRIEELTPYENKKYGGGRGNDYVDFIVKTLKPEVDKRFRTLKNSEHTAILGSSLGGLISYYAGLKYPDVFGKIGVFSPSFWINPEITEFTKTQGKISHQSMYFMIGSLEGNQHINDMKKVVDLLEYTGYPKKNIMSKVIPDGQHNESMWRKDFKTAITWMFNLK